jgi:hypothetical protein
LGCKTALGEQFSAFPGLENRSPGQTPHRQASVSGVDPWWDRPRLPTLRLVLMPCRQSDKVPSLPCSPSAHWQLSATLGMSPAPQDSCLRYRVGSRRLRRRHVAAAGFSWTSPAVADRSAFGASLSRLHPNLCLV